MMQLICYMINIPQAVLRFLEFSGTIAQINLKEAPDIYRICNIHISNGIVGLVQTVWNRTK